MGRVPVSGGGGRCVESTAAPPAQSQARVPKLPRTPTYSSPVSRNPASSLGGRRGAIAASRGRDRFAPDSPHRQAGWPISTGGKKGGRAELRIASGVHRDASRRRGQVFSLVSGALPESGAPRDARDVRIAPHYRSRSRLSISGGSVCADGFLVGVPFTLQWTKAHLDSPRARESSVSSAGARSPGAWKGVSSACDTACSGRSGHHRSRAGALVRARADRRDSQPFAKVRDRRADGPRFGRHSHV